MQFRLLDDKIFYPLAAVIAVVLIALSTVWPQGLGSRAPAPFGHAVVLPDYFREQKEEQLRAAKKAADRAARQAASASEAASDAAQSAASDFASS